MEPLQLGQKMKDTVTGFEGVAIGRCEYLHGVPEFGLQALSKEGKPETHWFAESRLARVA